MERKEIWEAHYKTTLDNGQIGRLIIMILDSEKFSSDTVYTRIGAPGMKIQL